MSSKRWDSALILKPDTVPTVDKPFKDETNMNGQNQLLLMPQSSLGPVDAFPGGLEYAVSWFILPHKVIPVRRHNGISRSPAQ